MGRKNSSARTAPASRSHSGFNKRHAFGQHFLVDGKIIHSIVDSAIDLALKNECPTLLEIGPGRGAITAPILVQLASLTEAARRGGARAEADDGAQDGAGESVRIREFVLVEKDRGLGAEWTERASPENHDASDFEFQVHVSDFLDLEPSAWLRPRMAVVSNLPYSAGTAIFTRMAEHTEQIRCMVLMFQAEVAKRLYAPAGDTHRGTLSLWTQNRWEVKRLLKVPPKAFRPPPKVDSEVVVVTPREEYLIPETRGREAEWESLIKTAFSQRRKTLKNCLSANPKFLAALQASDVDPGLRAQALDWDQWRAIFLKVGP